MIGYAELDGQQLVDCGVRLIRRHQRFAVTLERLQAVVRKLLSDKRPSVLVIEKNNFSAVQQNAGLVMAISGMKAIAGRQGIPTREIAANSARKLVCGNGYATKRDVANVLRSRYPELSIYIDPLDRRRQQVFLNVFDAVACAIGFAQSGGRHD